MSLPKILITNDDGYRSEFLVILAERFARDYEVTVAAPATQKSWIAKAITRHQPMKVTEVHDYRYRCFSIDGTPADCVNLALGNLMEERPAFVLSGINIGFNATLPLVLSSGTVGGALEASLAGHHAFALSQVIPQDQFEQVSRMDRPLEGELRKSLEASADRSVELVSQIIQGQSLFEFQPVVHNLNFPIGVTGDTLVETTQPARANIGNLFQPVSDDKEYYQFTFRSGPIQKTDDKTDLNCLRRGHISYSLLDFSAIVQ